MSISEGDIIKAAMHILMPDATTAINVFWFMVNDDVGSGPLDEFDVLDALVNWMDDRYANIVSQMSDLVSGFMVEGWKVDLATGDLTPFGDQNVTWEGTSGGDPHPNGVASICTLKTTATDVTGRKYLPGWAESTAIDNNLGATGLTALVAFVADWIAGYVDPNDVELLSGVYSLTKHQFFLNSSSGVANGIVGYQRRRKPGVGS